MCLPLTIVVPVCPGDTLHQHCLEAGDEYWARSGVSGGSEGQARQHCDGGGCARESLIPTGCAGEGRGGGDKDDEEQEQAAAPSGLGSRMGGGVGGGGEWEGLASVSGGITTIQSAAAAAYSSGFF